MKTTTFTCWRWWVFFLNCGETHLKENGSGSGLSLVTILVDIWLACDMTGSARKLPSISCWRRRNRWMTPLARLLEHAASMKLLIGTLLSTCSSNAGPLTPNQFTWTLAKVCSKILNWELLGISFSLLTCTSQSSSNKRTPFSKNKSVTLNCWLNTCFLCKRKSTLQSGTKPYMKWPAKCLNSLRSVPKKGRTK